MTYVLHYAPDNASLIVRLALEELSVRYRTALVDRATQAQRSPEYLGLNPAGLIPVLETPPGPIFETGAILLWLVDRHGMLGPAPDAPTRGDFLKWLFFVSNTLHADLRGLFYPDRKIGPDPALQDALCHGLQALIPAHLAILDAARSPALGQAQPTVIDFYVAACLRWCALYGPEDRSWFDLAAYPHLRDICARLETRPSVQAVQAAEGLGPTPFTAPVRPNPPEGSPT